MPRKIDKVVSWYRSILPIFFRVTSPSPVKQPWSLGDDPLRTDNTHVYIFFIMLQAPVLKQKCHSGEILITGSAASKESFPFQWKWNTSTLLTRNCVITGCTDGSMMTSSNGNNFRVTAHLCGEFPGEFHAQRQVTRSFDIFFDLRLNKQLNKWWWGWWFETPSRPLWRHCNVSSQWPIFQFQLIWIRSPDNGRVKSNLRKHGDSKTNPIILQYFI